MSYLKYSNMCGEVVRASLKEPFFSKAKARENENDTKNKKTYGVATLAGFLESSPKRKSASKQCDAGFGKRPEAGFGKECDTEPDLYSAYAVPLPELKKAKKSIHAVTQTDRKCNCFTKSYGKFVKGTGSFLPIALAKRI